VLASICFRDYEAARESRRNIEEACWEQVSYQRGNGIHLNEFLDEDALFELLGKEQVVVSGQKGAIPSFLPDSTLQGVFGFSSTLEIAASS